MASPITPITPSVAPAIRPCFWAVPIQVRPALNRRGVETFRGKAAEPEHAAHSLRLDDTPATLARRRHSLYYDEIWRLAACRSMPEQEGIDQETEGAPSEAARQADLPESMNGDGSAPVEQAEPEANAEQLQEQLAAALQERDEMLAKLQRSQAEFENIRKRLQKEKDGVVRYAASDTIQSLLPIIDDFERAINADGVPDEIKKGLELIHRRIFEVFSRAGLAEVEQHETFDPNLHFAVDRAPAAEDQSDQQILEVYQKGYRFKDRLMRASMVKVAVKE